MPFEHLRVGHPGAFAHKKQEKRAADCNGGNFYKTPTNGQIVDILQPITISWDTSCMDTQLLDMYLYVPSADNMRIHYWSNIDFAAGSYTTNILPRWLNDTASTLVQIQLVPHLAQPWMASLLPSGPIFTANYTQPASGAPSSADVSIKDSNVTTDASAPVPAAAASSNLSGGKIAAAVIMPILAIVVAIVAYLVISHRKKGLAKRKEWTEQVDKRMSTISTDWKSLSGAGANAAIRQSMAANRNSSYSFGRPTTVYSTTDGGQAGVGARSLYSHENGSLGQMSQLRPGLRTSAFENRVSRVSFAEGPRPSLESRRSRALHTASTYEVPVPPLPTRQDSGDSDAVVGTMSPRQANGAVSLTADDIRARIDAPRHSTFDEVLPALSLMRTGGEENDEGAFIASDSSPSLPQATHPKPTESQDYFQTVTAPATTIFSASPLSPNYPTSPVSSNTSQFGMLQPMLPANLMSPDDMLRAYAERNAAARGAGTGMLPTSTGTTTPAPSTYSLGAGTGFGANNTGVAYPNPTAGSRRSLIPAGPGAYSPSRGAYGVSSMYDEGDAYSVGLAE